MYKLLKLLEENQWSRRSPSLNEQTCPICYMPERYDVHDKECWLGQAITEFEKFKVRLTTTLGWMVADMTWKADQTKGNLEEGSQSGYSKELTEAITLLTELKGGT